MIFSQDDINFFSTVASVSATLMGLTFVTLIFMLTDLLRRYDGLVLPVHLKMFRSRMKKADIDLEKFPENVTDFDLFDGDPLVVFSAFSIGVNWNMFFVSFVVSLTAVSAKFDTAWVFAVELLLFWAFLTFSMIVRNKKRDRLNTYRTRDEHLWPVFEWTFVVLWAAGAIVTFLAALAMDNDGSLDFMRRLTFWVWTYFAVTPVAMVVLVLKVVCLGGLFFALYIINKDLFVYFKARASDEMRQRWLRKFTDRYSYLAQRVSAAKASKDEELVEKIKELWNNGCPSSKYILDGFSPRPSNISESGPDVRWKYLLEGKKSVAVWMFDVPGIARWESELENLLNKK